MKKRTSIPETFSQAMSDWEYGVEWEDYCIYDFLSLGYEIELKLKESEEDFEALRHLVPKYNDLGDTCDKCGIAEQNCLHKHALKGSGNYRWHCETCYISNMTSKAIKYGRST